MQDGRGYGGSKVPVNGLPVEIPEENHEFLRAAVWPAVYRNALQQHVEISIDDRTIMENHDVWPCEYWRCGV
jgi:hypothetical protein